MVYPICFPWMQHFLSLKSQKTETEKERGPLNELKQYH